MNVPEQFRPHIFTNYPTWNFLIFEEWLAQQTLPETEREYLPIFWTSYWVNNNYGNDINSKNELQKYIDTLDRSKKYWTCFQYDDSLLIDTKDLDIITFGMSYRLPEQKPNYILPLIGQPYSMVNAKNKYLASFVGNITHPLRTELVNLLSNKEGYYISTKNHYASDYNTIISQSTFTIAPRGYGIPSFRAYEAIQQNSIPVYISDEFAEPYGVDFNEYGVKIKSEDLHLLPEILASFTDEEINQKKQEMNLNYYSLCAYEGVKNKIIETLKNEG